MLPVTRDRDLDHSNLHWAAVLKVGEAVPRKDSDLTAPDILKASEGKMDRTLLAYSREKTDSELHKRLIDDLKKAM